jgi:hypothetical protein
MEKNTVMWIVGGGLTYYFLSTRIPQYQLQIDGTYLPATFVDRLTVAITGVAPPPPQPPSTAQNIQNYLNTASQIAQAIQPLIVNTN